MGERSGYHRALGPRRSPNPPNRTGGLRWVWVGHSDSTLGPGHL